MWTKVTGKLDKQTSSNKGELFAGRREEVKWKQNGLKLTNRFTFKEEEETCPDTECLMQKDGHVILGMFMIGKQNIFKLGKARKVLTIPNEGNCGEQSKWKKKNCEYIFPFNKLMFQTACYYF